MIFTFHHMEVVNIFLLVQVHEIVEEEDLAGDTVHDHGWIGCGLSVGKVHDPFNFCPAVPMVPAAADHDIDIAASTEVVAGGYPLINGHHQVAVGGSHQGRDAVTAYPGVHGSIEEVPGRNQSFCKSGRLILGR